MHNKEHILFTATFSSSFISEDLNILRKHFNIHEVSSSGIGAILRYAAILPSVKITYSWFASVYSSFLVALGKIFGKKSIVILGGVDVAKIPELQYGIWNSRWRSVIVKYGITHADIALAVDPSIKHDAMTLAQYDGKNISVLPTGHDETFWVPGKDPKKHTVLSVAACDNEQRFRIKGIDFLYSVANALPEVQFILVGVSNAMTQRYPPPPNIKTQSYTTRETLLQMYQHAQVYFQPSMREALGSALCEAMLCECYPIGTTVGGIPTVIGTVGKTIPFGDVQSAAGEIQKGLKINRCPEARERITTHFSLKQREKRLQEIITGICGAH